MRFSASLPLPAAACAKLIEFGSDPRAAYAWLQAGDPLELQPRIARIIRQHAVLIDVERLLEGIMLHLAKEAGSLGTQDDLNEWLNDRCGMIIASILEHDAAAWLENPQWLPPRHEELCLLLALSEDHLLRGLFDFHRQPLAVRRAFFELLINGKPVLQCLAEGLGPPWLLRERCLYAMKALYLTQEEKSQGAEGWCS